MARLKSRNSFPPLGFQFLQPQTGWSAPANSSFDVVVRSLIDHRIANPFVTKQHNLSIDYDTVAQEVDEFNAARCLANPRWANFVEDGGGGSGAGFWQPQRLKRAVGSVVASAKRTAAGVKLVYEWFGDGLKPVDQELAEKRAETCVACDNNGDPNWIQKLDALAAQEVKTKMEIKNDLKLETKHDDKLMTCQACDCDLKTKIWTPLNHVLNNTSKEVMADLATAKIVGGKKCWIIEEAN
jgi:hypothetical protein